MNVHLPATVYNCGLCNEPKVRHHRTGEWVHIRGDSLCDDDYAPYAVTINHPPRRWPAARFPEGAQS